MTTKGKVDDAGAKVDSAGSMLLTATSKVDDAGAEVDSDAAAEDPGFLERALDLFNFNFFGQREG